MGVSGWGKAGVSELFYFASKFEIKKMGEGGRRGVWRGD